jgi:hemerythrin-like metal-binding protein
MKNLIAWEEKFNTGINHFDKQHKKLVKMLNELYYTVSQGKSDTIMAKTILELLDYTRYHFTAEEKAMSENNFEEYQKHKKEHEKLMIKVEKFQQQFVKGDDIGKKLFQFMKNWLLDHILISDKKYGPVLDPKLTDKTK